MNGNLRGAREFLRKFCASGIALDAEAHRTGTPADTGIAKRIDKE